MKRIPKGILDQADTLKGYADHCIAKSIGTKHDLLDRWKNGVAENWPNVIPDAWLRYQRMYEQNQTQQPDIPRGDKERVCAIPWKQAIREDLPQEHKDLFLQRLQQVAVKVTNMKADLLTLVKATMLEGTRRGYRKKDGTIQLDERSQEDTSFYLKIEELLPDTMIRDRSPLLKNQYIPVAPLPDDDTTIIENDDFVKLFKQEHIQRIYRRDISALNDTTSKHPLWDSLKLDKIPFTMEDMTGLSDTGNIAMQEVAVNTANLWKTNIFHYSLNRLLLLYYRGCLAPMREKRYKELVAEKSKAVKEEKEERQKHVSRDTQWQRTRKEKRNIAKCEKRLAQAKTQESAHAWKHRLDLASERHEALKPSRKEKLANPTDMTGVEYSQHDKEEDRIALYLNRGVSKDVVVDIMLDEDDDDEEQEEEKVQKDSRKECSSRKIKQLVAFTKKPAMEHQIFRGAAIQHRARVDWRRRVNGRRKGYNYQYLVAALSIHARQG